MDPVPLTSALATPRLGANPHAAHHLKAGSVQAAENHFVCHVELRCSGTAESSDRRVQLAITHQYAIAALSGTAAVQFTVFA